MRNLERLLNDLSPDQRKYLQPRFEEFSDIRDAIDREKQIKAGSRQKKIDLVNSMNPGWRDLYDDL